MALRSDAAARVKQQVLAVLVHALFGDWRLPPAAL